MPVQALIVINGPIAAGKSTVAQALGRQLRNAGRPTAVVVDLDELYLMMSAKPMGDPQVWPRARRAAATLTDCFLTSGTEIVVVEGAFWDEPERAPFLNALPWRGSPLFVTLLVSYDVAYRRVQGDSGRSLSRSPEFLRRNNEAFAAPLDPLWATDLVFDSDAQSPQQIVTTTLSRHSPTFAELLLAIPRDDGEFERMPLRPGRSNRSSRRNVAPFGVAALRADQAQQALVGAVQQLLGHG